MQNKQAGSSVIQFNNKQILTLVLSCILLCFCFSIDLYFLQSQGRLASFAIPPFSLFFGASVIVAILHKTYASVVIAAAPLLAYAAYTKIIEPGSINQGYLLILGVLSALQSQVVVRSFNRSSSPETNSFSKKLIIYIWQTTIISAFISILLVISHSFLYRSNAHILDIISVWTANLTSLVALPSLYYSLKTSKVKNRLAAHPIEWFICLSVATLGVYFAKFNHISFALIIIPTLMWSSVRFNQTLNAGAIFVSSFMFLNMIDFNSVNALDNLPEFASSLPFLLVVVSTLYFGALRTDQAQIEEKLEDIVQQRTQDLLNANQELRDEVFIREQAEQNLLTTSKRYRALIETAGIPIIVLDNKFRIKQWNTAAEIMFAYTKEEILGANFIDTFVPESLQDETAWKFMKVLESGLNKENMESEILSRDGLSHTMLWNMTFFSGDDNETKQNQLLLMGQNISGIRQTQNQLHYLAHYDALTDTANRRLFEDRCAQAIQSAMRHKSEIALIGLDIDHFKRINDTLGHDIGDQFLVTLARRLKESVRREDTVARLGGDEFAILLASVSGREGAEIVARNILRNITQPINIKGNELIVTSSIGITICPNDGSHFPDLLKNADMAMYRAKKAGRNNIQFYSPEMNNEMKRQLRIEQELRGAILESQFRLHYQPVIDIETGEVLALEALLRWKHPDHGIVSPEYFIDIAEQTGQLHDIGRWVINNAFLQGRAIQEWSKTPIQIALNLSNRQFNHPSLIETIKDTAKLTRFDLKHLILEMSESTITQNTETSYSTLLELKQLGISLTIDSFGTGLSSLRQLKQIPIDIIKVDRTFVAGIPSDESDMAITETLLAIASQMDLRTFATGIETKEQEAFLKINGCRYGQGYLYSPPLPFKKLPDLFEQIRLGKSFGQGSQIFLPFQSRHNDESNQNLA